MVTAQQIVDLNRLVKLLQPDMPETKEYLTLLKTFPGIGGLAAIGGEETDVLENDVIVNNSEVLIDTGLESSNLIVGAIYHVDLTLLAKGGSAVPDLRLKFEASMNTFLSWELGASADASVAVKNIDDTVTGIAVLAGVGLIKIFGILRVIDTIGTLKLRFAQSTANAIDTEILNGSTMKLTRIK